MSVNTPKLSAAEIAKRDRLLKAGWVAAGEKFDFDNYLANLRVSVPAEARLKDATEALLQDDIAEIDETDRIVSERLMKHLREMELPDNVLYQSAVIRDIFHGAIVGGIHGQGLEITQKHIAEDALERFDSNETFRTNFMKAEGFGAEQKADARKALSDRLEVEKDRIKRKRDLEARLIALIDKRAMRISAGQNIGKTQLMASGKNTRVTAGSHPQQVKDGVYLFSQPQRGNFLKKFFLGNYEDMRHFVKEGGTLHEFQPANKKSIEFVVASMRAQGMTRVEITLGEDIDKVSRFGAGSPEYYRTPREAGLDFKFRFETGLPYDVVKEFLDDEKFTLEQMEQQFDAYLADIERAETNLLSATDKASRDAAKKEYIKAKNKFDSHMKIINKFFGSDKVSDADLAVKPITADIKGLTLGVAENERYETALEIRAFLAKKVRPAMVERVLKNIQLNEATTDEEKAAQLGAIGVKKTAEHVEAMMKYANARPAAAETPTASSTAPRAGA